EVDGIPGETPSTQYSGLAKGSISLDNYLRRVMLAINLNDRTILFTDQLTAESRVLLNRAIHDRVASIAPFLLLDEDPYVTIVDAYGELFPGLFRPIGDAPPALAEHFRYPEEFYDLQTEVFSAYHVTDPTAFYNGEDRWQVAAEEVESSTARETKLLPMESYY